MKSRFYPTLSRLWTALLGAVLGAVLAVLAGCSAPVARVVLLPQADASASAVVVQTERGLQTLDQPYQSAEVSAEGKVERLQLDPTKVLLRYGPLLVMAPQAPTSTLLYFETGGSELTADSARQLPDILEAARQRPGGEIVIIGHTDRVGSVPANDALSLKRAQAIAQQFVAAGFEADRVEAVGRGERAPLVDTADEVAEPRNRRVEVVIR